MEINKIYCDECEKEFDRNSLYWQLSAINDTFEFSNSPRLDRDHHFCGKGCLGKWLEKDYGKWIVCKK